MKDQDEHRRHIWEVTETQRFFNEIIEYERCTKCNAKRVLQYPPGMILESEPKPVPKYCPATVGQAN